MRLRQIGTILLSALLICSWIVRCSGVKPPLHSPKAATSAETTAPVSDADHTRFITGEWESLDTECKRGCGFVISRTSDTTAKMVLTGSNKKGPLVLHYEGNDIWGADTKTQTNVFLLQEYNGLLTDGTGVYWHRVSP